LRSGRKSERFCIAARMQLMAEKFMNQQEGLFGSALLKKEATFRLLQPVKKARDDLVFLV